MTSIEEIITGKKGVACDTLQLLKDKPDVLAEIFRPLTNVGFHDFKWAGEGSNAFFLAPTDNDKIVFRVSSEDKERRNDVPFFLAGAYEKSMRLGSNRIKLEVLLAGKHAVSVDDPDFLIREKISEGDRNFLLEQMKLAGWQTQYIEELRLGSDLGIFWNDVVMISVRDKEGRMKNVPIISDPSASNHVCNAIPSLLRLNVCGPDYITMQDQAAAYNAARDADSRLKTLIPQEVAFPETAVIPVVQQSTSVRAQ